MWYPTAMGDSYRGVQLLDSPDGTELHMDQSGRAKLVGGTGQKKVEASLSGPVPKYSTGEVGTAHPADRSGMSGTRASQATGYRSAPAPYEPHELLAHANAMLDNQAEQHRAQLSSNSLSERDDAGGILPSWLTYAMRKNDSGG